MRSVSAFGPRHFSAIPNPGVQRLRHRQSARCSRSKHRSSFLQRWERESGWSVRQTLGAPVGDGQALGWSTLPKNCPHGLAGGFRVDTDISTYLPPRNFRISWAGHLEPRSATRCGWDKPSLRSQGPLHPPRPSRPVDGNRLPGQVGFEETCVFSNSDGRSRFHVYK